MVLQALRERDITLCGESTEGLLHVHHKSELIHVIKLPAVDHALYIAQVNCLNTALLHITTTLIPVEVLLGLAFLSI